MAKRGLIVLLVPLLASVLLMGLVGVALAQEEESSGDPIRGSELYVEFCLACHGTQGAAVAEHEAFAKEIHYSLGFVEGVTAGLPGTYMAGYGLAHDGPLSDGDISDIAAYAQTWESEDFEAPVELAIAPELELTEEEALGAELYIVNCSGCHNWYGQGRDGLANFPPIGEHVDVLALARRGVSGSRMPPFAQSNGGALTEEDLTAIQAYIRTWDRAALMTEEAAQEPQGILQLILLIGLVGLGLVAWGVRGQHNRQTAE